MNTISRAASILLACLLPGIAQSAAPEPQTLDEEVTRYPIEAQGPWVEISGERINKDKAHFHDVRIRPTAEEFARRVKQLAGQYGDEFSRRREEEKRRQAEWPVSSVGTLKTPGTPMAGYTPPLDKWSMKVKPGNHKIWMRTTGPLNPGQQNVAGFELSLKACHLYTFVADHTDVVAKTGTWELVLEKVEPIERCFDKYPQAREAVESQPK